MPLPGLSFMAAARRLRPWKWDDELFWLFFNLRSCSSYARARFRIVELLLPEFPDNSPTLPMASPLPSGDKELACLSALLAPPPLGKAWPCVGGSFMMDCTMGCWTRRSGVDWVDPACWWIALLLETSDLSLNYTLKSFGGIEGRWFWKVVIFCYC